MQTNVKRGEDYLVKKGQGRKQETFLGRLGRDPKVSKTKNDKLVCDFSIAVEDLIDSEPRWIKINAWGGLGMKLSKELKKGEQVFVKGELAESSYTDRSGHKRVVEEMSVRLVGKVY